MYLPSDKRYDKMIYSRCGRSGLKLPKVSMGLWQNFGHQGRFSDMEEMVHTAFDLGITHFDLANNYGNPYNGSAEENFGRILDRGMREFRDELCISTKAGYEMWDGPYGDRNGSRKYLIASLDQSLRRMKLDYVDIFYHHVFDPDTPLEETAHALDQIVRQGKALYVGISNYNAYRNYDGNRRIFFLRKVDFSVSQILLTYLKITFDKVLSFLGGVHLHHFTRMKNRPFPCPYHALLHSSSRCRA